MYRLGIGAVIALCLMYANAADATTVEPAPPGEGPVNRTVDIASLDRVQVKSYYRQRPAGPAWQATASDRLWGLEAFSRLPVSGVRAQLEYAVWVPPEHHGDGLTDSDNRMFRLRVDDRKGRVNYGARVFSVGDAFPHQPVARERLNAVGLNGPGDGLEMWLGGRLPVLGVRPQVSWFEASNGDVTTQRASARLTHSARLGAKSRLFGAIEATSASNRIGNAAATTTRDAIGARINLSMAAWTASVRNTRICLAPASGQPESLSEWEVGTFRNIGHDPDAVNVGLWLRRQWHLLPEADDEAGRLAMEARLQAPLRLWDRAPPGTHITTSIGYQAPGAGMPAPGDGFSVRFQLNLRVGS